MVESNAVFEQYSHPTEASRVYRFFRENTIEKVDTFWWMMSLHSMRNPETNGNGF
jgi:hypothetical protein